MDTIQVSIKIPRDLAGALDIPLADLAPYLQEMVALELFRQGRISSGKAAELMGITKIEFMRLLGKHNIPYFTLSPNELEAEVDGVRRLTENPTG
ncbi:MAG: UPF0175 family protein [Chloroflexi bacterium]|nr:UPF0175 family protein [Chloroflexota bacterium]MCL5274490.1 UPF0175 family protein [Chloroflexota bacterium]